MLSVSERAAFETDGLLLFPPIRGPEAMDTVRRELDEILTTPGLAGSPTAHRHLDSAAVFSLITSPAIMGRVADILGPDLLLWHSRFFDKPANEPAIPWHQDMGFWPIDPRACVSVWIAIDRADRGNACVEAVPGSHRLRIPHIPAANGRFRQQADPSLIDLTGTVAFELDPGGFAMFDGWLLHGSPANSSGRRRLGLAARFVPTSVAIDFEKMKPRFEGLSAQLVCGAQGGALNRLAPVPVATQPSNAAF